MIVLFLYVTEVSAGTLDDIRTKSGWVPAVYSKRETVCLPIVAPSELVANLDEYHRNTIRMQVMFDKITTQGLNTWIGSRRCRYRWSSKRYIAFRIKDLQKKVCSRDIYFFLNKNSLDKEILLGLTPDVKITVTGFVKNIDRGKAWIDVNKIDLGWEKKE